MSKIEIIRESGEYDIIDFSFRYVQLTEYQKNIIENKLVETNTNLEFNYIPEKGYIIILKLDNSINPETIKILNDQLEIDETNFGIWISMTTNYDYSGFSFPEYIIKFIRIVGGTIDFSTIMISNN